MANNIEMEIGHKLCGLTMPDKSISIFREIISVISDIITVSIQSFSFTDLPWSGIEVVILFILERFLYAYIITPLNW